MVVVNLRPDADAETEFVGFDRPRVVRVLDRIAADLDNLSLVPNDPHVRTRSQTTMILKHAASPRACRAAIEAEETELPRAADGIAGSAGTTATVKKIRPCVQKTERLSAVFRSAATGNPTSKRRNAGSGQAATSNSQQLDTIHGGDPDVVFLADRKRSPGHDPVPGKVKTTPYFTDRRQNAGLRGLPWGSVVDHLSTVGRPI